MAGNADAAAIRSTRRNPHLKCLRGNFAALAVDGLHGNRPQRAVHDFVQSDQNIPFHIAAPPRSGSGRMGAGMVRARAIFRRKPEAGAATEILFEEIAETRATEMELRAGTATRSVGRLGKAAFLVAPIGPELVVLPAFFEIAQDFEGLVDFLEFLLAGSLVRRHIRMVFPGQLAKCLFDHIVAGIAGDPERGVVVFELDGHGAGTNQGATPLPCQAPSVRPEVTPSPMHEAFGLDLALEGADFCR